MAEDSRDLVDPELVGYLDGTWPTLVISAENLAQVRALLRDQEFPGLVASESTGVDVETRLVKGPEGSPEVPIHIYQPRVVQTPPVGGVFHMHGGGFIGGDAAGDAPILRPITAALGCVVVDVDYRLAPETRFPGNIEDCYAALSWLFDNSEELGVDRRRIGVMGQSAGGGLAAALALLARDRGEFKIAFQHLTHPMIDDRSCVADPHPVAGKFIWTSDNNRFAWSALLGVPPGSSSVSQYAAASRADDLARLPQTFLSIAGLDLFLEENLDYGRRLMRAGVQVELHVYPGAFHGFDHHPTARIAQAARRDSLAALARFLKPA